MDELENYKRALKYAIRIIENYQMDIRGSRWVIDNIASSPETWFSNDETTLADIGFCQGIIYKTALDDIENFRSGKRT